MLGRRAALVTVGHQLALISTDHWPPSRPSADLLLTSLALVAAQQTIAVILSGGGSDGATGAVALHDFGGTVIAADKAPSAHFGMPEAAIGRDDAVVCATSGPGSCSRRPPNQPGLPGSR